MWEKLISPTFLKQKIKAKEGDIIEISEDSPLYQVNYENLPLEEKLRKLSSAIRYRPGDGMIAGRHEGSHFFTIGQRKGLHVGGKERPLFVIDLDVERNIVYVGQGEKHHGLFRQALFIPASAVHWIRPDYQLNAGESRSFSVRIRYRQPLQKAGIYYYEDGLYILFEKNQRGITPGQFAAWYDGDELIGSGVID